MKIQKFLFALIFPAVIIFQQASAQWNIPEGFASGHRYFQNTGSNPFNRLHKGLNSKLSNQNPGLSERNPVRFRTMQVAQNLQLFDSTQARLWDFSNSQFFPNPSEKTYFDYDAQNNLTAIRYAEKRNGGFLIARKELATYNSNNQYLTRNYVEFDTLSATWKDVWRMSYSYYPDGKLKTFKWENRTGNTWNLTEFESYTYDETGNILSNYGRRDIGNLVQPVDSLRELFTYNTANKQTSYLGQVWNGQSWMNDYAYRDTSTYDSSNRIVTLTSQVGQGSVWRNNNRSTFFYSAAGDRNLQIVQTGNGSVWDTASKSEFNYNSFHNKISELYLVYNGASWDSTTLIRTSYNAQQKKIAELQLHRTNNNWENFQLDSTYYDSFGREILKKEWTWETGTGWKPIFRYSHFFPEGKRGNLYEIWDGTGWFPYTKGWQTIDSDTLISAYSEYSYLPNSTVMQFADSVDYFYQVVTGNLPGLEKMEFLLYPNPANNYLYIQKARTSAASPTLRLELADLQGKKLREWQMPSFSDEDARIELNGLPNGFYLLKLDFGNTYQTRKIQLFHP